MGSRTWPGELHALPLAREPRAGGLSAGRQRTRPTIGVLVPAAAGYGFWLGTVDAARERQVDLICFAGRHPQDPRRFQAEANVIYDLIDTESSDGLIVWTSSLASYVGRQAIEEFCRRYRPLPIVSVGMVLEGIPSLTVDSFGGMREAVRHLIEDHGRRRVAFIRGTVGHHDADQRYQGYLSALRDCGLPCDPDLVSPPYHWYGTGGTDAIRLFLEERRVRFDALAATNDSGASEAMEALQALGLDVPGDVAVVGFNNSQISEVTTPPLTTVPLRMYERARRAVDMLLALIAGEPVPGHVCLATHPIIRQSCGCRDPAISEAVVRPAGWARPGPPSGEPLVTARDSIAPELSEALTALDLPAAWAGRLLDAFLDDLNARSPGVFLATLEQALEEATPVEADLAIWQGAVSALRRHALPPLADHPEQLVQAENLWGQARVLIGERAQRVRTCQGWSIGQQMNTLRRISQTLTTVTSVPELLDVLVQELPQAGVPGCYLCLYEDPQAPATWSRLRLAYDEQGRVELPPDGLRFPSPQLMPGDLWRRDRPHSLVVQSLHFREEQLGFVMFEAGTREPSVYDLLSEQISSALWGTLLLEQNVRLYEEAKAAREEAEEANRLKSRFLSVVSHELRTPLSVLVGLSQMMLRPRTGDQPPLPAPYRQDLSRIHVSAQQLDGLIHDVLDLAHSQVGHLKLVRRPLRLDDVLQTVALVGEQMAREKGLEWRAELPQVLPCVWGDRTRLQQVLLNLVSNAVKFTPQGSVTLSAEAGKGEVTVRVSDTGLGVPLAEQEAIFDEFRQSELTASRGYGGLGVGLALCRRLVQAHGGAIGVDSPGEEASGSTFYFTLPIIAASGPGQAGPEAHDDAVLILTGGPDGADLLAERLRQRGFEVRTLQVGQGRDWLPQVLASPPAAVVLDFEPASERAWELMRALKESPATDHVPLLFYSLWQAEDRGAALDLDYLAKPLDAGGLARALERQGLSGDRERTVLVVDDEPGVLELHAQMVQEQLPGCRVLRAADGRQAWEEMQRLRPDLVLLDLMMPELDGFGLLELMQQAEATRDVPVIVLTAQVLAEEEMARLSRGVAAVLQKGVFSRAETLMHVEKALARRKALGDEMRQVVRKVMAYIHQHYGSPISREDMAAHACVSERHLDRCFRHELGVTPMAYLNRYRIKRAKVLLAQGDTSISDISLACGFSDSSYFARVFRREVGVSPGAYRRGQRPA